MQKAAYIYISQNFGIFTDLKESINKFLIRIKINTCMMLENILVNATKQTYLARALDENKAWLKTGYEDTDGGQKYSSLRDVAI